MVARSSETASERSERDDSLADAFRSVARLVRQASVESLSRWDLAPSQFRALRVLLHHGALRPSALSEHLHIAPRSTTEVLDGLAGKGLIERAPDPQDRRATLVTLTEHGREIGEQIKAARGSASEQVFDKLSPADRSELVRILGTLLD